MKAEPRGGAWPSLDGKYWPSIDEGFPAVDGDDWPSLDGEDWKTLLEGSEENDKDRIGTNR